jgi:hypothetical protein
VSTKSRPKFSLHKVRKRPPQTQNHSFWQGMQPNPMPFRGCQVTLRREKKVGQSSEGKLALFFTQFLARWVFFLSFQREGDGFYSLANVLIAPFARKIGPGIPEPPSFLCYPKVCGIDKVRMHACNQPPSFFHISKKPLSFFPNDFSFSAPHQPPRKKGGGGS